MIEQVRSFDELPAALSVWPGLGQALGVGRCTAYQLIKQPGFPALKISNRKIVIPKDKLLEYIEKHAEAGVSSN